MAKRGSPALYELIRARGAEPTVPSPPPQIHGQHAGLAPEAPDEPLPGGWLRPGRLLRIPLGYVFVAVAAAIILCSLTYMAGYSRGKQESLILYENDVDGLRSTTMQPVPRDPLDDRPSADPQPPARTLASHSQSGTDRRTPQWGPIESNPRQSGMSYLILMETRRAGAERFANFSRNLGLETYMVPVNNTVFRIFALPGFEHTDSEQAREFREDVLLRVGEPWRQNERVRDNPLGSSYWSVYRPSE